MKTIDTVQSADGTTIAFESVGTGRPLVIVNGALSDRSSAASLVPMLAPVGSVYAYDRRGRGASGNATPYSVDREIEDLAAVVDAAGGEADVYAHSSGGYIAVEAALREVPFRRLILHEPPYIVSDDRARPGPDLAARLEELIDAGDRAGAIRLFYREAVALPDRVIEQISSAPAWPAQLVLANTLPYDALLTGSCELPRGRLAELRLPTLVLYGDASPQWIQASARALADAVPVGLAIALRGQRHESPAEIVGPEIIRFLGA